MYSSVMVPSFCTHMLRYRKILLLHTHLYLDRGIRIFLQNGLQEEQLITNRLQHILSSFSHTNKHTQILPQYHTFKYVSKGYGYVRKEQSQSLLHSPQYICVCSIPCREVDLGKGLVMTKNMFSIVCPLTFYASNYVLWDILKHTLTNNCSHLNLPVYVIATYRRELFCQQNKQQMK